jgi:N-acetylglucosamine-6-phosphate deacetylase
MSAAESSLVFAGTLVLADRLLPDGVVVCRAGKIAAVGPRAAVALPANARVIEAGAGFIAPGYVDIHVHGGGGADFMDGTTDAVRAACRTHGRHGTTSILPTTTTGSREQIAAMLDACEAVQAQAAPADGARIVGVHFYGPYFAEDKVGCHLASGRRDPDPAEYRAHFDRGIIRVATCAAELPGAEEFFREATRRGCFSTCGHSNASWAEMQRAFDAGMRHVDHFWCAMSSVSSIRARCGWPSQGSMEQFVLAQPEMSTELIADGCHLAPELLEFAWRMKGPRRLLLVTDANRAVDMPPGRYRFGPQENGEWFESDGRVGVQPGGGGLASSVVGLDAMVRIMATQTAAGIVDSIRMATLTPAERVGLASGIGSLEVGKRADVLVLDADLRVKSVHVGGNAI